MQDRLVFLIGVMRSGSTLTARMLGTHSQVHAPDEPHLVTPLAHLGFHEKVDGAPYDPLITQRGLREFVSALPRGEDDYLDGLRACTDTLYERALQASGKRFFLDKTPAYGLVLDFLAKLYPEARYLVLTRHPLAVWSSFVDSFFDGDHETAHAWNPVLERYVPAIGRFLRERPVRLVHVRYEELVAAPEAELGRICEFLGIDFEPAMVDYGSAAGRTSSAAGLGDPVTVGRETRPTTKSVGKWTEALAADPAKLEQARTILARLLDEDLETWGFSRREIESDLDAVKPSGTPKRRPLTRYSLQRKILLALRRNIHQNVFGRWVRWLRTACDVLLR